MHFQGEIPFLKTKSELMIFIFAINSVSFPEWHQELSINYRIPS